MKFTATLLAKIGKWSNKYANLPERYINRITERVREFVLFIFVYVHFVYIKK